LHCLILVSKMVYIPKKLPTKKINNGLMLRICGTQYSISEPGFRATGGYRFDSPDKKFSTLYCSSSFETCYYETVVRDRGLNRITNRIIIPKNVHHSKSLVFLFINWSKLRMVNLCDSGAKELGLDASILMGSDYSLTQSIAKSIYEHQSEPHGVIYRSRFDMQSEAIVLFDRASTAVRVHQNIQPTPLIELSELFVSIASNSGGLAIL
jgi:RES domain